MNITLLETILLYLLLGQLLSSYWRITYVPQYKYKTEDFIKTSIFVPIIWPIALCFAAYNLYKKIKRK